MTFPLSSHPGTIVFVDDEDNFLETIRNIFASNWLRTFSSAKTFIEYMNASVATQKNMGDVLRTSIDRVQKGGSVAMEVLRYWNLYPERFDQPQVVVIDYYMPSMNGLEALGQCAGWRGKKILLSGADKDSLIAGAFNQKQIDLFIPKQNSKLIAQIRSGIESLLASSSDESLAQWNAWYLSITSEQRLLLQEPEIQAAIKEFVGGDHEYVIIGNPFGVLALGYGGGLKWLQFTKASELDSAAEAALANGCLTEHIPAIRSGRSMSSALLLKQLGSAAEPTVQDVKYRVTVGASNEIVYGAVFEFKSVGEPTPDMCFDAWQARKKK